MGLLPPQTRDKDHIFKNVSVFGEDDDKEWQDRPIAVLKHSYNNVKLYIDASSDNELSRWRYSNINFKNIRIINNHIISLATEVNNFASYFNENSDKAKAKLEFKDTGRFITYKPHPSLPRRTLNRYDGIEKSDLDIDFKNRYSNYQYFSKFLKFDIYSFSQWGSATLSTISFLNVSEKIGQIDDVLNIQVQVKDSNGEGVESAPIYLTNTGKNVHFFYSDGEYSLTDVNGIANIAIQLKEHGIINIKAQVDLPAEIISENFEINCVEEETEVYVRGVSFETKKFVDNPKALYNKLRSYFEQIQNLNWEEFGITQSSNISYSNEVNEDMMVFIKKVKFNGSDYISELSADSLRNQLMNVFTNDNKLNFQDVEIRTYRKFVNLS